MSISPEQDPESTTDKAEAFEPAYKSSEYIPKTTEELRVENVAMRAKAVDELNATNPRVQYTEVGFAQDLATNDDMELDAEKAAAEKAETDAVAEKARVDQEVMQEIIEKDRQQKSDQERAEMQAEFDEHWKQREALRKSLTRPTSIWVARGQSVNNPDYLNESQIDAQLKQFDNDWEAEQARKV